MNLNLKSEQSALKTVGERLRAARQERGLTQEVLAGPEFTKGYVSALERGAVRPSLKALDVFARRLNIPIAEFLLSSQQLDTGVALEIGALQEDLTYQLSYSRMLIRSHKVEEALSLISEAERHAQPHMEKLPPLLRYRIPFLRGLAHLQLAAPELARPEFEAALEIAREDEEAAAAVRNLLGVAYYQLEQPQLALEHHLPALRSVEAGRVKDLSLRLSIYRNLGNDYWALNDLPHAIGIYEKALPLLEDLNDLERQAGVLSGLAAAYRRSNDLPQAKLYSQRALHTYEAADNLVAAGTIGLNLAEILTSDGRFDDAQTLLGRTADFLSGTRDAALHGNLSYALADLARQRGDIEEAARHIAESLRVMEAALPGDLVGGDGPGNGGKQGGGAVKPWSALMRTYAEALHRAALIEEARGNQEEADTLFEKALDKVKQTGYEEMLHEINFSYGETLSRRGAHERAVEYYRAAAQPRSRSTRLGN